MVIDLASFVVGAVAGGIITIAVVMFLALMFQEDL